MIRKFCRNLLLRVVILSFTGGPAVSVLDAPTDEPEKSAATRALQALDRQGGTGWQVVLLPVRAYQVIRGSGF
jgi:hypothetical protein